MTRLIDADALLKAVADFPYGYRGMIESEIENQPTVDALHVRHAKLLNAHPYGECSNCGYLIDIREEFNYCPNCGAMVDADD